MSSVFSKLKQFKDLREQGKKLQGALGNETSTGQAAGGKVVIIVDGSLKMKAIEIDNELLSPDKKNKLQDAIKDAHTDAQNKMQRIVAAKMQEMGGFDLPGMK
ncbi:MAG: YbaB/EbfC family nucleoid-associated protein [Patescibacteria group bacterium]